jgi:hypothetical protein
VAEHGHDVLALVGDFLDLGERRRDALIPLAFRNAGSSPPRLA